VELWGGVRRARILGALRTPQFFGDRPFVNWAFSCFGGVSGCYRQFPCLENKARSCLALGRTSLWAKNMHFADSSPDGYLTDVIII